MSPARRESLLSIPPSGCETAAWPTTSARTSQVLPISTRNSLCSVGMWLKPIRPVTRPRGHTWSMMSAGLRTGHLRAVKRATRCAEPEPTPLVISWPTRTIPSLCLPICRYPARSIAPMRTALVRRLRAGRSPAPLQTIRRAVSIPRGLEWRAGRASLASRISWNSARHPTRLQLRQRQLRMAGFMVTSSMPLPAPLTIRNCLFRCNGHLWFPMSPSIFTRRASRRTQ